MLGMAVAAREVRVTMRDGTVQGRDILHLRGNVRMADRTTVRHAFRTPRCDMTIFTIPAGLGVGSHAAQSLLPYLCIKRAGTVESAATREGYPRDDNRRQQCGNDSR